MKVLTMELLRNELQFALKRGYHWYNVCEFIKRTYKDYSLFTINEAIIKKGYESRLSFRELQRDRNRKVS